MRVSRGVGGVLVFVVLALVAWLYLGEAQRRDAPRMSGLEAEAPAGATQGATPGDTLGNTLGNTARAPATLAESPNREEAVATPAAPEGAGADELEVRVVLAGAPAAQAELWFVDWELHPRGRDPLFVPPPNRDEERRTLGQRFTADARGRVLLSIPRAAAALVARLGDAYGELELVAGEPGPLTLELFPDPPVRVRVRELTGVPAAGVPVVLRDANDERDGDVYRAITDADGNARLFARRARARLAASGGARVGLALLLREPVEASVDLARDALVELVVPATGSVAVALFDDHGQAWSEPARFGLGLSQRGELELGDAAQRVRGFERVERGHVLFERVGLDLGLVATAATATVNDESTQAFRGPHAAGERVSVELHLVAPSPVLVGRLLDAEGVAVGPAQLRVSVGRGSGERGSGTVASDGAGRFRWVCFFGPDEVDHAVVEVLAPFAHQGRARVDGLRVVRGENELGDLELAPTPWLVGGTVRDETGAAVRGAQLSLYAGARPGVRNSGRKLELEVRTDARGRFACRQLVGEAEVGIAVQADGFAAPETTIVPVGTTDVEIVLQHGGSIHCEFRLVSDLWPNIQLLQDGRKVSAPAMVAPPGYFLGPVPPGSYALRCFYPWSEASHTIEGIEVVAGKVTQLEPIDLRTLLPVVALTIVDELGASVENVKVALRRDGRTPQIIYARPDDGRWLVAAGTLPVNLLVEAPGFRALELDGVDSDRRVVLRPGPRVRFELAGALPELSPDWHWTVWLAPLAPSPLHFGPTKLDLGPGVQELHAQGVGPHRLFFGVVRRLVAEPEEHRFGDGLELTVTDEDSAVLRLSPPSAELLEEVRAYIEDIENE